MNDQHDNAQTDREMLAKLTEPSAEAKEAAELGKQAGYNAATWVLDGNTSNETYATVLKGIQVGDPEVMDAYNVPNLSGEMADSFTQQDLEAEIGLDLGERNEELIDQCCTAWENAASTAFWDEIERVCKVQLPHIDIDVINDDGKSLEDIAAELIGVKGKASFEVIGDDGGQWPTIRFYGTVHQLAAVQAKSEGHPIGRPLKPLKVNW